MELIIGLIVLVLIAVIFAYLKGARAATGQTKKTSFYLSLFLLLVISGILTWVGCFIPRGGGAMLGGGRYSYGWPNIAMTEGISDATPQMMSYYHYDYVNLFKNFLTFFVVLLVLAILVRAISKMVKR